MNIRIITDSAADIQRDYREDLTVLPMYILIDGVTYRDGVDLSNQEFYEKLIKGKELPKTSQIAPYDFEEAFQKAVDDGEVVIAITISSKLSGTFQSASIAAGEFKDFVYVVDSENVAMGQKALVHLALRLKDQGKTAEEIVTTLNKEKKNLRIIALLDTLEYLKKGGRISASKAMIGGMLSIKPVVGIEDGEIVVLGKSRGSKNANNLLMEQIAKAGGIDFSMPYFLGYTGLSDELMKRYIKDSAAIWENETDKLFYSTIGAAIGTHVGPGAIAIAFFEGNRNGCF